MKSLYILSSGELRREGNTLCLENSDGRKFVPITNVSDIYVFGEVSFNKRFLEFMTENHVLLHFFNYYGFYTGSYVPRSHYSSGYLIIKQAEHYMDASKRIAIAGKFVYGAARNMMAVLKYYGSEDIRKKISEIEDKMGRLKYAARIEELMALEGNIREDYYSSFNFIIKNDEFRFTGRQRRPPGSPLNALISFGNGLMYAAVLSEIYRTHLDPRIGYLHESSFRKFTLNLDVAEIFKPIIVDRLIFSMINRSEIDGSDFSREMKGIFLNEKGRSKFLRKFDERLEQTITIGSKKISYRRLIRLELYKLEKHLIGEKEYEPYVSEW
ncbi:MAG: type I-B CRISPR-associated endonuclease Cas1b [Nitrososphaeria archaeon]